MVTDTDSETQEDEQILLEKWVRRCKMLTQVFVSVFSCGVCVCKASEKAPNSYSCLPEQQRISYRTLNIEACS